MSRVLVAMSGGVDSSVAAALLKRQGFDVIGVTMQVWDYSTCEIDEGNGTCCSSLDVDDARAVADHLGIPFYVVNCEEKFKATVVDDFVENYLKGRTPIPCVNCNTFLKFDHLIQKMLELDCEFLATGHYAKNILGPDGVHRILTSSDDWKDQTYFLFTLKKEILPRILFPVGHLKKPQLRELALELGLPVAQKRDSTGICFIGPKGYGEFIESRVAPELLKPGVLRRHPGGEVLGEHGGIHHFTFGQRKGLGISSDRPLYVVRVDSLSGDVWLGEETDLLRKDLLVESVQLLDQVVPGEELRVKIRYAHKGASARVQFEGGRGLVEFQEPQRAVTPGQAAVFYRGDQLVGGGWIK